MSQYQNFGAFKWMGHSLPPKNQKVRKVLPRDLAESLRTNWPSYTIRIAKNYREKSDHISDPQDMFGETCTTIHEIRQNKRLEEVLDQDLKEGIMNLVFSSNNIERAGLNLQETLKICQRIFDGEDVKAEDISEKSEEYQAVIQALIDSKIRKPGNVNICHVIQSRREVIQHVRALDYITRAIVIENQPLSEALICTTHRLLVTGIDRPDTGHGQGITPWQKYRGNYRRVPVITGTTTFVVPEHIPRKMQELVEKFNKDTEEAEKNRKSTLFT
ncbi:hypothetical protein EG329_005942 [Mollisiaceae sp. DMI_Dod_QoI]|nr:hypothetical protein EG329_005942 [Helotiales sp. DMI_Dod_QoI]